MNQTEAKPSLELKLESMEKIEDQVQQWMMLEEHWTQHNLDRREQLDIAKKYFANIMQEITNAYKACPTYAGSE